MENQQQPCIYDQFWNDLRNKLEDESISRDVTQALNRVFVEEQKKESSDLLQGFWHEKFKNLFSEEEWEKISTEEKFVGFCNTLYSVNDENDPKWDILTKYFQAFCYSDILSTVSYYNIGVNIYMKYMNCSPFEEIVDKKTSRYNCKEDSPAIPGPLCATGAELSESKEKIVDEKTKRDQMIFATKLSLPFDILKVYFKGTLGQVAT